MLLVLRPHAKLGDETEFRAARSRQISGARGSGMGGLWKKLESGPYTEYCSRPGIDEKFA